MAEIVLGIGSSHSPQVSSTTDVWPMHVERDKIYLGEQFQAREQEIAMKIADELRPEVWQKKYDACQVAIDKISEAIEEVNPDVLLVVGDDQEELFFDDAKPAFGIFWGDELKDLPHPLEETHPSLRPAMWAWHTTDVTDHYPIQSDLAHYLLEQMMLEGFDVSQSKTQLADRSLGHAYTFVRRRLMKHKVVPMVPVFVNCFYQPNQPTPARCYELGRALRRGIESWGENKRVAVIGSGGLSHFVLDEKLDEIVIDGLKRKDETVLKTLPRERLQGASGEILNWVTAAGALEHLDIQYLEYVSGYRSPAGTGVGMTFAIWK